MEILLKCPVIYSTVHVCCLHFNVEMWLFQECENCGKQYKRGDSLNHHLMKEHPDSLKFDCPSCSDRFTTKKTALRHQAVCRHKKRVTHSALEGINLKDLEDPRQVGSISDIKFDLSAIRIRVMVICVLKSNVKQYSPKLMIINHFYDAPSVFPGGEEWSGTLLYL